MKRIVCIASLVALLSTSLVGRAAAQEPGPRLRVAAGLGGYCRSGDWCPVYAVLANEGSDVEGELQVTVGSEPDVYGRSVALPARSRKGYTLYVPVTGSASELEIEAWFSTDDGDVLSPQAVEVRRLEEGERTYGVLGASSSALGFLGGVALPGEKAAVAYLESETLPPDPLGWEMLDVIVVGDVDTAALDERQHEALRVWTAHGGHLIVGGGAGATRAASGVADLLPVSLGGTRSVDELTALGEHAGAPVSPGPYAVSEVTLREGEALVAQGDLILLARRAYGAGWVDFLAYEPGLNPFAAWSDNHRLWRWIVGVGPASAKRLAVRSGSAAREAARSIPGVEPPSTGQVLLFLLAYIALVGPVNYLLLRAVGKRDLAWVTVPFLILLFAALAYWFGVQGRGGEAILNRLSLVYVPQGVGVGRVSRVVGVFSPRRTSYDLETTGSAARSLRQRALAGPDGETALHVVGGEEGVGLDDLRVDVGGVVPIAVEGYAQVSRVEADLRLVESTSRTTLLEGTVRNGDVALQDAILLVGSAGEQRVGDLEPGQSIPVSYRIQGSGTGLRSVWDRILGAPYAPGDLDLRRRRRFLDAIFGSEWQQSYAMPSGPSFLYGVEGVGEELLGDGVYLVGWGEAPGRVGVVGRPFSDLGVAFYVYALPVTGPAAGGDGTLASGLFERKLVDADGAATVDPGSGALQLWSGARVLFRFTAWPGTMVRRVEDLTLNWRGTGSGPPGVWIWDWRTGEWAPFDLGWGAQSIPQPGSYVTSTGCVLVRLEMGSAQSVRVDEMAITIGGQP